MMPQYIFMGFIFGLISVFDDGIECAMGAHTANNIFNGESSSTPPKANIPILFIF